MEVRNEVRTGLFVLLAFIVFAVAVWILGQERNIFGKQYEYFTAFRDVKGLSTGAHVRLGGISIGRVNEISFSSSLDDPQVYVSLLVNADYLDRIRKDATVSLQTQGLLGDRFLALSLGKGEPALPGATLKGTEEGDFTAVLQKAAKVVDNTVEVSERLAEFMKKVETETLDGMTQSAKSLSAVLKEIETGDGLIHDLIYSKQTGKNIVNDLSDVSKSMAGMMKEVETGEGVIHALIYDPKGKQLVSSLTEASEKLAGSAAAIEEIATEIKGGSGLAHHMIYGETPEGLDSVVNKLNDTAQNLKEASAALAQGQGTLGALLVDSQLYDNLVEVTDGAKRSFILKQAIRSSMKR